MKIIADAILAAGLHEIAHVAAAKIIGVRVYQVGISWKGPFIRRDAGTTGQNLTITLAGPGINLLLALILYRMSPVFALSNFVLGLSNLLPFQSSDGSRALSLLTNMRQKPPFRPRSAQVFEGGEPAGANSAERRREAA